MSAEVAAGGLIAKWGGWVVGVIVLPVFKYYYSRDKKVTDDKLIKHDDEIETIKKEYVTKSEYATLSIKMDRMLICVEGIKAEQDKQKGYQQAIRDMQERGIPNS